MIKIVHTIFFLFFFVGSVVFSFVDPQYDGYLDLRYRWLSSTHKGTGSFSVENINLQVKFPLDTNYLVFYETNLNTSIETYSQLYLDLDGLAVPMNLRFGRFDIPFGNETLTQTSKYFISNSIIKDYVWGNSVYMIPRQETGVLAYYHSRTLNWDAYLVNGGGAYTDSNFGKNGKSIGTEFRFPVRDLMKVGFSFAYNDISTTTFSGGNNQYILAGTDVEFELLDVFVKGGVVFASGKLNGVSKDANGVNVEGSIPLSDDFLIGSSLSVLAASGATDYRLALLANYLLNKETSFKTEVIMEETSNISNVGIQTQILVDF